MKKTVLIDFDGTMHSYVSGWQGADVIPDPPNPDAIKWLQDLMEEDDIEPVIWTTRVHGEQQLDGERAIRNWLYLNGMSHEQAYAIEITAEKKPAWLMIDDRAFTFRGAFPSVEFIETFVPWRADD